MFVRIRIIFMMRIALYGPPDLAHKHIDSISNSNRFLLSGIKAENGNIDYPGNLLEHPVIVFENEDDLLNASDVIIFLNFKNSQYLLLKRALKESKHVLINPSTFIPKEVLSEIQKLGEEAGVLYYLRHKSLNTELLNHLNLYYYGNAEFIDIYRYIPAGIEKNQSLIHKIIGREVMFMLSIIPHEIIKFKVKTVPYYSLTPFIINIRFEFSNCSAVNLTINSYTETNARFAELYFETKMLRINSDENKIEFANRDTSKLNFCRKDFNLLNEGKLSDEVELFLHLLSEQKYPAEFKNSGLAAYQNIYNIINVISGARKSAV